MQCLATAKTEAKGLTAVWLENAMYKQSPFQNYFTVAANQKNEYTFSFNSEHTHTFTLFYLC